MNNFKDWFYAISIVLVMVAVVLLLAVFSGCSEGPIGPQGEQGNRGVQGQGIVTIEYTGTLTADMLDDSGDFWFITIPHVSDRISGIMAFVGTSGVWVRSPLWVYGQTTDSIRVLIYNTDEPDGDIQEGWEYQITVFVEE